MTDKTDIRQNAPDKVDDATDEKRGGNAPDHEQKLDESLEDSMDASDPPSTTKPDDHGEPVPSSGYTEKED